MDTVSLEVTRQATVVARTFGVVGRSGVAAPCRAVELAVLSGGVCV